MNLSDLQKIKEQVSIYDVAESLLRLEKQDGKYKYPGERTASIKLYPENNRFHDFGRNVNGDIFDLMIHVRGCTLKEATAELKTAFNIKDSLIGKNVVKEAWIAYLERKFNAKYVEHYDYFLTDQNGKIIYAYTKVRLQDKAGEKIIIYGRFNGDRFILGLQGKKTKDIPAIYGSSIREIQEAIEHQKTIFYVEGEKDTNTLMRKGYTVFTCGGSGDWKKSVSEIVRQANVIILADNDEPGEQLAYQVMQDLQLISNSVSIIKPMPNVDKADITDYFEEGHSVEEFEDLIKNDDGRDTVSILRKYGETKKSEKEKKTRAGEKSKMDCLVLKRGSEDILKQLITLNAAECFQMNDRGSADLFATIFKNVSRYNPTKKDWMYYDKTRWTADTEGMRAKRNAKMLADVLVRYSVTASLLDDKRQSYIKYAAGMMNYRNRNVMITDAKDLNFFENTELDKDDFLLNCKNCVLDLSGNQPKALEHNADLLLSKICNASYNPAATCTLWEKTVTTIGKKLIAEESVQTLAGNISNLTNGALAGSTSGIATFASSLGSLVGTAGAITLVTAGTVMLTKKIAELVETAQGGNGILTQTGGYLHDYAGKMGEAHAITNKQVEELWALVEADETAGKSNSEMYDSMVQKLGEYGVSAEKATQILEQYGAQAGVSSAFVEEMTGKVQALGKGFSESSSTIDTSSITVKESIKGIRSVLYDLSVSSSEYAGTYRGVLEVFNNTSGSAANAQDAFNIVYNALKEAGVPLDELNKKLAQEFPSAAQATKSSVASSIVEAQKTVSSSTGKMKTDAETNLAGVKKAAEDASGGVNTTTVTNWGNSASEVKKNLDKMKQTANLKLGEMQKTVESHFSGQYNTMTKKWEKACERIGQLITQMVRSTKDSLNGLARNMNTIGNEMSNNLINGISGAVTGIAGILNEVVSKVNSTIGNVNSSLSGIEKAFTFSYDVTTPDGKRRWGKYSMNLPRVNTVPYLAKGAVIPPRSEFLAVLGDQKQGNNIETPEALLRKIVREETAGRQTGGGSYRFTAQINRRTLFDEMMKEAQMRRDTSGRNPFEMA